MEQWDIYDSNRVRTGKIKARGTRLQADEYHLVIHVCIINSDNQLLIQQRQPFKSGWPNLWDVTVGGSALAGENSQVAAERELMEEIGYEADLSQKRPNFSINFNRGFDDFYILKAEVDLSKLTLQYEEVQAVKWANREEIIQMIEEDIFIPYHLSVINMIFDMQHGYGSQTR